MRCRMIALAAGAAAAAGRRGVFALPDGVDKPVLAGGFRFDALDRGLFRSTLVGVANQEARGRTCMAYVTSAPKHPDFVGVHGHQSGDRPATGRFDGGNFRSGLADVCDTPCPETIAGIRAGR